MTRAAPRCTCRMLKDYPCPVHSGTDYDLYPVAPAEPVTIDGPIPPPKALVEPGNTRYTTREGRTMSDETSNAERISEALAKAANCLDKAGQHPDPAVMDSLTRQAGVWIELADVTARNERLASGNTP